MQIKNTTDSNILHKNSGISFTANTYTQIGAGNLSQLSDNQMFNLLSSGYLVLNDGMADITSPSIAWSAINKIIPQNLLVTTQYELNDKTLKVARVCGQVDSSGTVVLYLKVPGQFGSGQGRYVVGGYGISEDYNKDDYIIVRIEDKDRIIAWMIAQAIDPNATEPLDDQSIQQMGVIEAIGEAFPDYPMIRSYSDEELSEENCGWYFWPLAQGNNLPPIGEVEVNPIGGYGFIPSGFYIKLIYKRPEGIITGSFRANVDWGRKD